MVQGFFHFFLSDLRSLISVSSSLVSFVMPDWICFRGTLGTCPLSIGPGDLNLFFAEKSITFFSIYCLFLLSSWSVSSAPIIFLFGGRASRALLSDFKVLLFFEFWYCFLISPMDGLLKKLEDSFISLKGVYHEDRR